MLGVDPGLNGAWAIFSTTCGLVAAGDLPSSGAGAKRCIEGSLFADILDGYPSIRAAAVEDVHAMPKQGVSSSFRFGQATGEVVGVIKGRRIPIHRPTPQRWKKRFDLIGQDKEVARQRAIHLWPSKASLFSRKMDVDRAEAALIAAFAAETYFDSLDMRAKPIRVDNVHAAASDRIP